MNKIGWCDITRNPVWGCLNEGECKNYCYARRMAKRRWLSIYEKESGFIFYRNPPEFFELWENLKNFQPTWIESNFQRKFPVKPARIFINSMSEIYYWKPEWMERVLDRIREYPQHTFQFLTKFPEVYNRYVFPGNCWLGFTITNQNSLKELGKIALHFKNLPFLSIEPILEPIDLSGFMVDWVIVGALSGTKKRQPEPKWIYDIYKYCADNKIPLFMKDSIEPYWNGDLIREFPGGDDE